MPTRDLSEGPARLTELGAGPLLFVAVAIVAWVWLIVWLIA